VQTTRDNIVDALRRAGLMDEAERAERLLPESGDFDEMVKLVQSHGIGRGRQIDRGLLVDLLGGSP
jgi:hypothetical protein